MTLAPSGPHSDHNYGNWTWDQAQTEVLQLFSLSLRPCVQVTYFDRGQGEPSDSQTEK